MTDSVATLVVVDGETAATPDWVANVSGPVMLLSCAQSPKPVERVRALLERRGLATKVESAAPAIDEVAPGVAEEYLNLLAVAPAEVRREWMFEGRLSMWWLHEASGRRSDAYPTFTRLCQLEVIRRTLEGHCATNLVLLSPDSAFARCVESLCDVLDARFHNALRTTALARRLSVAGIAARLALWSARLLGQTLLAKLLTKDTRPSHTRGPVAMFHTIFPTFFMGTGGTSDEKFLRVPNLVREHGIDPFIGVTFAADDGHQHLPMREYVRACLALRRSPAYNGVPVRLVDRDLPWPVLLVGLAQGMRASVRQLFAERSNAFRQRWRLSGVDVFPLVQYEMRIAAYRTPRYLVHLLRMRAAIDRIQPDAVVSSLFEFCYGRATSYAIASSRVIPLNIGAQHGPTGRKLMYRFAQGEIDDDLPLPDHLLLEGEEAQDAFLRSGFPADRLHVLGAPRFDRLADPARWSKRETGERGPIRVLVAFGLSDGAQILAVCAPVIAHTPGYHFIMKPHPRSSIQPTGIEDALGGGNASSYEIAAGTVYDILPTVDAVIATYSSVGQEAAALGYPTIVLNLPDFASPSGLLDVSGSVRFAASSDGLVDALNKLADASPGDAGALERTFFWKLDGHAQERWAETIARLINDRHGSG